MNKLMEEQQAQDEFPYDSFAHLPIYEQRRIPRWKIHNRAYYRDENTSTIVRTQTIDLSATGACVHADAQIGLNHKLKLKIHLSETENFEVDAVVVWKSTTPDFRCHIGVLFSQRQDRVDELIMEQALFMK